MKLILSCVLIFFFIAMPKQGYGDTVSGNLEQRIFYLDGPSSTPAALFVQSVLEQAYGNLGYQIEYLKFPMARGYKEANEGRIDGLRARVSTATDAYPNLLPVPFPLLEFNLQMIADRRVCGVCDIQWLNHVATTQGLNAFEEFKKQRGEHLTVEYVARAGQAFEMALSKKVEGAILTDTNMPPQAKLLDSHWIKTTLQTSQGFHYLHKKHQKLIPALLDQFQSMQNSGQMDSLRKRFGIETVTQDENSIDIGIVKAITAPWTDVSDSDQATFQQIMSAVYTLSGANVESQLTNWKRAKASFFAGRADVLIGAYAFEQMGDVLVSDAHIDYEYPVFAFAKSNQVLDKIAEKSAVGSVCHILGYDFQQIVESVTKPYEVADIDDCITLLKNDRVDLILDYQYNMSSDITNMYSSRKVIDEMPLFVFFHNDKRGKILKRIFERGFRQLLKEGRIKPLFPDQASYEQAKLMPSEKKEKAND